MEKQALKVINVHPDELVANPWNSNKMSPENEMKVEESLKQFGFFKPIIARRIGDHLEIIGGQHRWEAATRMGYTTVPVIDLGPITDKRAKQIGLVDNGRYGNDDVIALADVLKSIGTTEEIELILPYSTEEMNKIFKSADIDLSKLDIDDSLPDQKTKAEAAAPTHATMKFRVRIGDQLHISDTLKRVMKRHGFTKDSEEVNAGDALTYILQQFEQGEGDE